MWRRGLACLVLLWPALVGAQTQTVVAGRVRTGPSTVPVTRAPLRVGTDGSNYCDWTVGATGALTMDCTGAGQAICIVTPDIINGSIRNGGIGTHCFNLARFLAGPAGQRVTVLFTAEQTDSDIGPWKQYYDRLGIEFVWIGELPSPAFRITCTGQPYAVLHHHHLRVADPSDTV